MWKAVPEMNFNYGSHVALRRLESYYYGGANTYNRLKESTTTTLFAMWWAGFDETPQALSTAWKLY